MKAMREDLHVLTGSYVLDAISDTEREEFERHLQHCPACEAEVRGMRETAARLALACAVTPPARMEQQVLAATYRTRQLPPLSADRPRRALRRRASPPCPAPSSRAVTRRVAVLAAAASVAAAVALGITQLTAQHQLDQARATAIARVVTAPDAHVDDRADQRGRQRHRRHLRRAARGRGQRQRDGLAAVQPGLPGVGDEPVRRALGRPDARQLPPGVRGPPGRPDRHHRRARGRHGPPHHHPRRGPARLACVRPDEDTIRRLYDVPRYIGLRYSVRRYRVDGVTDRLDRWADPPLLVLASLADEPKHGYAITQDVAETMGVRLSAGTLYAVIARLEARGLIEPLESDDRRRPYRITMAGAEALAQQSERMSKVASVARERLSTRLGWAGA